MRRSAPCLASPFTTLETRDMQTIWVVASSYNANKLQPVSFTCWKCDGKLDGNPKPNVTMKTNSVASLCLLSSQAIRNQSFVINPCNLQWKCNKKAEKDNQIKRQTKNRRDRVSIPVAVSTIECFEGAKSEAISRNNLMKITLIIADVVLGAGNVQLGVT